MCNYVIIVYRLNIKYFITMGTTILFSIIQINRINIIHTFYPTIVKQIYLFNCKDMSKDIIDDICNSEGVMVKYIE